MKNVILTIAIIFGVIGVSFGQETAPKNVVHATVEIETAFQKGIVTPQVKSFVTYDGKGKVGAYCWVQNSQNFNQIYCGPTFSPKSWVQIGVAAGAKTGAKNFQAGAFVWIGKKFAGKMVSNLLVAEKGGTWFRNTFSVQATTKLTTSLVVQRYKGLGPRLEYRFAKPVSAGVEYKFSANPSLVFGLKLYF